METDEVIISYLLLLS